MIITQDLLNIVNALHVAKQAEFMSREHAGSVWKKYLKDTGLDVVKTKEASVEVSAKSAE